MSQTTLGGPVRTTETGFQLVSIAAGTGAVTVVAQYGANASVANLVASGTVILSGLPTADPLVAGQLWSNLGVLTVSAG